jgi:hypothetical protein
MKKRLLFFFRYLTASRHFRQWRARWLTTQTLLVAALTMGLFATLAWSAPPADANATRAGKESRLAAGVMMQSGPLLRNLLQPAQETPEPNQSPTRTPLPAEYLSNSNQTFGITLGSVVLVCIVLIGVLVLLPRMEER